jgi:hypothetical protein
MKNPVAKFKLSEDWLATLIGLAIVLVIGAGLLGPGPQRIVLKASPGETHSMEALARDDWEVSATLGGDKVKVGQPLTTLAEGQTYVYTCQAGAIAPNAERQSQVEAKAPSEDHVQLVLVNECDQQVALTYQTDYAVHWPLFGLLK